MVFATLFGRGQSLSTPVMLESLRACGKRFGSASGSVRGVSLLHSAPTSGFCCSHASLQRVVESGLKNGYTLLITADHGNADFVINEDGSPNTAHTKNPVPFFLIDKEYKPNLKNGKLADIAPTVLKLMGIEPPKEMTGESLV